MSDIEDELQGVGCLIAKEGREPRLIMNFKKEFAHERSFLERCMPSCVSGGDLDLSDFSGPHTLRFIRAYRVYSQLSKCLARSRLASSTTASTAISLTYTISPPSHPPNPITSTPMQAAEKLMCTIYFLSLSGTSSCVGDFRLCREACSEPL